MHFRPRCLVEEPSDTVPFCGRGAGALGPREERKLAAGRSFDDEFCEIPLLQIIFGFEDAFLNKIKAIGGFATSVKGTSDRVSFADEVWYCAPPERFGLGGYGREGLEDQLNGLLV